MRDILIVEDGLHERQRLEKIFRGARYSVCPAEDMQEAERLLKIEAFRLVVLDIGLGDKSGSLIFEQLIRSPKPPFIIILTGNPSIHLKQRFLDQGACAYIVKASPAAESDALLELVGSLLGTPRSELFSGIPLRDFLQLYIDPASKGLFLDQNNEIPACQGCGQRDYIVSFSHRPQVPPLVEGKVLCAGCQRELDLEVG